ncbi:MAG: cytochrome b [Rhodospirillales bacterium]|nr:cytochrome b [Rhodospirillales bacterium]MDE2319718.1 cytochrome b [Rhodospirillales bacterium]
MNKALEPALPGITSHDRLTIILHWLTALLVVVQFLLAEFWGYFPRPVHSLMIVTHMSFGLVLTALLVLRLGWRLRPGHTFFDDGTALLHTAARLTHWLLYALLAAVVAFGFLTRWTDNKPLSFFGLLIPSPLGSFSRATGHFVDQIHDYLAWAIIILAGVHAAASLLHHFYLKDGVLRRMLPQRR